MQKIWLKNFRFKATILLTLLVFLAYFWFSQGALFIPAKTIDDFSFGGDALQNLVFYLFIHIGIIHLISNTTYLLIFGLIAERELKARDIWGLFFSAGIGGAIILAIIDPGIRVVGASAGITGLITASIFFKPKYAVIAMFAAALLVMGIGFAAEGGIQKILQETEKQITEMQSQVTSLESSLEENQGEVVKIEEDVNKAIDENNLQRAEQLKKQALQKKAAIIDQNKKTQQLKTQMQKKQEEKTGVQEGAEYEKRAAANQLMHAAGATIGVLYLIVFRRKEVDKAAQKYLGFFGRIKRGTISWLKKEK